MQSCAGIDQTTPNIANKTNHRHTCQWKDYSNAVPIWTKYFLRKKCHECYDRFLNNVTSIFTCCFHRRRVCINKAGAEVEPSKCYNVEDYLNPGFFGTDSETGLCPACSTSAAASSAYVTFASSLTPSTTAVMQETTEEAFLTSAVDETSLNSTFARLMATARDVTTADVVLTEALATSRSTAATSKAMETTPSLRTTLAPFANGTAEAVLSTGESVRTPSVTVAATTSLTSPLPTFPVTRSSDIKSKLTGCFFVICFLGSVLLVKVGRATVSDRVRFDAAWRRMQHYRNFVSCEFFQEYCWVLLLEKHSEIYQLFCRETFS